jgi:hypothetical protein
MRNSHANGSQPHSELAICQLVLRSRRLHTDALQRAQCKEEFRVGKCLRPNRQGAAQLRRHPGASQLQPTGLGFGKLTPVSQLRQRVNGSQHAGKNVVPTLDPARLRCCRCAPAGPIYLGPSPWPLLQKRPRGGLCFITPLNLRIYLPMTVLCEPIECEVTSKQQVSESHLNQADGRSHAASASGPS